MDQTFVQWLLGQSGIAGVAAIALWLVRKNFEDLKTAFEERDQQRMEAITAERQRTDKLIAVIESNVEAAVALREVVQGVKEVIVKCAR